MTNPLPPLPIITIDELLATRGRIAFLWSIEDVLEVRPDLTEEQAWLVLQDVQNQYDATIGVTWSTLEVTADWLFPPTTPIADDGNSTTKPEGA